MFNIGRAIGPRGQADPPSPVVRPAGPPEIDRAPGVVETATFALG